MHILLFRNDAYAIISQSYALFHEYSMFHNDAYAVVS